jgi:hypothetical protein
MSIKKVIELMCLEVHAELSCAFCYAAVACTLSVCDVRCNEVLESIRKLCVGAHSSEIRSALKMSVRKADSR